MFTIFLIYRIIVADVYDSAARAVMCAAYQLKMTAQEGYVWFLPQWLHGHWYDTDKLDKSERDAERVECKTEEMIQAINGHLSLAHSYYALDDDIMQENITVKEWREKYENKSLVPSPYAGFAYDAVWVYALAIDKLYRENPFAVAEIHSDNATDKYVQYIQETDFHGVSGRIKFLKGASRMTVINILQWIDTDKEPRIVGTFYPNISDSGQR